MNINVRWVKRSETYKSTLWMPESTPNAPVAFGGHSAKSTPNALLAFDGCKLKEKCWFFSCGRETLSAWFCETQPVKSKSTLNALNQRSECHLDIPRMAFIGVENPSHKKVYP